MKEATPVLKCTPKVGQIKFNFRRCIFYGMRATEPKAAGFTPKKEKIIFAFQYGPERRGG